jgi:hypothetical protein
MCAGLHVPDSGVPSLSCCLTSGFGSCLTSLDDLCGGEVGTVLDPVHPTSAGGRGAAARSIVFHRESRGCRSRQAGRRSAPRSPSPASSERPAATHEHAAQPHPRPTRPAPAGTSVHHPGDRGTHRVTRNSQRPRDHLDRQPLHTTRCLLPPRVVRVRGAAPVRPSPRGARRDGAARSGTRHGGGWGCGVALARLATSSGAVLEGTPPW